MNTITYVITMPDSEAFTPFQGYGAALHNPELFQLIELLPYLPHTTPEIYCDQAELIQSRLHQDSKNTTAISPEHFRDLSKFLFSQSPINVVLCLFEHLDLVNAAVADLPIKPIIITTGDCKNTINIQTYKGPRTRIIDVEIDARLKQLAIEFSSESFKEFPSVRTWEAKSLHYASKNAGVTRANERLMLSLGFEIQKGENTISGDPQPYIDGITESITTLIDQIDKKNKKIDFIIYTPSIISQLYDFKDIKWNAILRRTSKTVREFIRNGIFRNQNYSGFTMKGMTSPEIILNDDIFKSTLVIRKTELLLSELGVSELCASQTAVSLRLPNAVNLHFPRLKELEQQVMIGDKQSLKRAQTLFKILQNQITDDSPIDHINLIKNHAGACTLHSDAPLEWIKVENGLPLMIRNPCSRIPGTPGNIAMQHILLGRQAKIRSDEIKKILVIRSFKDGDIIKPILERSIKAFPLDNGLKVEIIDVNTIDEVISALNTFDGHIVAFDCHGTHGGNKEHGWLKIGDEDLDTWTLAFRARVPPIVLLSACLTIPIAGSHASVANGLLRSGAISVVATLFSVNAIKSAILIARILFRLDGFLSALKSIGFTRISWRDFMSGMFKMSYATDVLHYFADDLKIISKEQYLNLGYQVNVEINSNNPSWYSNLTGAIGKITGKTAQEIERTISEENPLMDTLMYTHIGRPELISITLKDQDENIAKEDPPH